MGYETRVVAFLDILGFKASIDKSNSDEKEFQRILKSLTYLKDFFIKPKDKADIDTDRYYNADTQIIQVSDCLIISRLIQEQGGIFQMFSDCAFAIHLLISDGFLCRGAIKYGKMYHRETTIFGQAYIDAFESEENEELPIIKFNKDILDIARNHLLPTNKAIAEWEVDFIMRDCKQIRPEEYYLDYFTDYDARVGIGKDATSSHYSKLRKIIIDGLKLTAIPSAYKKYRWAPDQFNLTANTFGLKKIECQPIIPKNIFLLYFLLLIIRPL
jgi:hypothetical protein